MRILLLSAALLLAARAGGAERQFNFSDCPIGQPPPGFRSTVAGAGKPGDWKVILDDVPSTMASLTPNAASVSKRPVLAQLARDPADEHFPLLIFEGDTYRDFTFSTRFKTIGGAIEQMAGVAFRIQDEKNYYVLRASTIGNTFRFYKVVDGERGTIIGPEVEIPKGVWHELSVQCEGNHIRCFLNGKEAIPQMTDNSFGSGKIGFWTKSDSVSYFADAKILYTPLEAKVQTVVRDLLKDYSRVLALQVFAARSAGQEPVIVASKDQTELGRPAGDAERDVIKQGTRYFARSKGSVTITMPLRDRNGDPIAAVRVVMKSFAGETQDAAVNKAQPIVKQIQSRVQSLEELLQ